ARRQSRARVQSFAGVDRSCNAGRDQRPDTRHTHQPPAHRLAKAEFFDLACPNGTSPRKGRGSAWPFVAIFVLSVLQYREERVAKGTRISPDGDALFDKKGSDLVDRRCSGRVIGTGRADRPAGRAGSWLFSRTVRRFGRNAASAIASASL